MDFTLDFKYIDNVQEARDVISQISTNWPTAVDLEGDLLKGREDVAPPAQKSRY
jgi:hypothetical protein